MITPGSNRRMIIGCVYNSLGVHFCDVISDNLEWHWCKPFLALFRILLFTFQLLWKQSLWLYAGIFLHQLLQCIACIPKIFDAFFGNRNFYFP